MKKFTLLTTPSACGSHPFKKLKGNLFHPKPLTVLRSYTLTVFFLIALLSPFTAGAQCGDITMTATATVATCWNNGTITVTIDGPDLDKVKLETMQLKVEPDGPGTLVDWFTPDGTGNVRTITHLVGDSYTVRFQAICQNLAGDEWKIEGISVRATVTTTWSYDFYFWSYSSPTSSCKPTGKINFSFNYGSPPYQIKITSAPSAYTGATKFSTGITSYSINNLPAGDYTFDVNDECSVPVSDGVTVTVSGNNLPYLYPYIERGWGSNCNEVCLTANVGNSYYNYEYAFAINPGDPIEWQPCNSSKLVYYTELPSPSYEDYCNNPYDYGIFYIRLKDCPTVWDSYPVTPGLSLCSEPGLTLSDEFESCTQTRAKIGVGSEGKACFPIDYVIVPDLDRANILDQGTFNYLNSYTTNVLFTPGVKYVAIFTERSTGKTWERTKTPATPTGVTYTMQPVQYAERPSKIQIIKTSSSNVVVEENSYEDSWLPYLYNSSHNCGDKQIYFTVSSPGNVGGTTVLYESGPQPLPMGSPGSSFTIEKWFGNDGIILTSYPPAENGTPGSDDYFGYSQVGRNNIYIPLARGKYTFKITNPCGVTTTHSVDVYDYEFEGPFDFETTPSCYGPQITINSGRLKLVDEYGNFKGYPRTYYAFRAFSNTSFWHYTYYSNAIVLEPGASLPFTVPLSYFQSYSPMKQPGTYFFEVSQPRNSTSSPGPVNPSCAWASGIIESDGAIPNAAPSTLSSYVCRNTGEGHIFIEAKGGKPPYSYWVVASGAGPSGTILAGPNSTGHFDIGGPGDTFDIYIQDNGCSPLQRVPVIMRDLANDGVAFTSNNGVFCEGSMVELNAVGLGENVQYNWYKLPDETTPVYTGARPRFEAVYPSSAGTYKVVISPEKCPGETITDYLYITINRAPTAPDYITSSEGTTVCQGSPVTLTAIGGDGGEDSAPYEWAEGKPGNFSPIGGNAHYITVYPYQNTTYNVRRVGTGGCAGTVTEWTPIEIKVDKITNNEFIDIDIPAMICSGTGTTITAHVAMEDKLGIQVPKLPGTPIFRWYASEDATDYLFEGNPFITPELDKNTTYWVSVKAAGYCEGEASPYGRKPITVYVNTTTSAPTAIQSLSGTEFCETAGAITLSATGGNDGSGSATYEWGTGDCGENIIPGATTASYTTEPTNTTTSYWVRRIAGTPCPAVPTLCKEISIIVKNCTCIKPIAIPKQICD